MGIVSTNVSTLRGGCTAVLKAPVARSTHLDAAHHLRARGGGGAGGVDGHDAVPVRGALFENLERFRPGAF
jgi:hypothetical protein